MATLPELENALRKAHAAGNVEHARRFAAEIRRLRDAKPAEWQPKRRTVEDLRAMAGEHDPTEGGYPGRNIVEGFGRSFVNTGEGIGQLFGLVDEEDIARRREIDKPLMDTFTGKVGNFAGEVTQLLAPVPGAAAAKVATVAGRAAPYIGAAARGATFAGAQGTVGDESRVANAAAGGLFGAAGQGIAAGGSALANRAASAMNPVVKESIDLARAAGIPLHLSQVTDSKALKTISSALNYLPFSGAGKAGERQQQAFNNAVLRSFGFKDLKGNHLSDDVMADAARRFGQGYDEIFARNNITLDSDAMHALFRLYGAADETLEAGQASVLKKQIERIISQADESGVMPGKVYQNLRSTLRQKFGNGSTLGGEVMEARRILDDAAMRSIGGADAEALKRLNSGYANFRTAKDALAQVSGAAGNVRPASLYPLIRKGSTKEMRELAKIGQNVLKDPVPDSGTPARELVYRGLGLTGGVAGGATALGVLPLAAKLGATGITAGRFLNSKTAAKLLEKGKPTKGLARLLEGAPKALPAGVPPSLLLNLVGGRVATPEEIAADEEIVRRFREGRQ